MASPGSPPPNEYEKALTHVAYEYAALESAFKLAFSATTTPPLIAAIDSFLVHYRGLVEFFHTTREWRRKFTDDPRAEDYVATWTTPSLPAWTKWKGDTHILLAHLSTKRNAIAEKKTGIDHRLHFKPMRKEIRAAWEAFAQGLTGTIHEGKPGPLLQEGHAVCMHLCLDARARVKSGAVHSLFNRLHIC